jgi:hypothetical protein
MPVGTLVCYVVPTGKVVFATKSEVVHNDSMCNQILIDSFGQGQPLPPGAGSLNDVEVKWTSLLLASRYPEHDTVVLDGNGNVTGITEVVPPPPVPSDYLIFKDGATELADNVEISFAHDSAKVLTIRKKDGQTNADKTGTENVNVDAQAALLIINASSVALVAGASSVTIGPQPANVRGCVCLEIRDAAGALKSRRVKLRLT